MTRLSIFVLLGLVGSLVGCETKTPEPTASPSPSPSPAPVAAPTTAPASSTSGQTVAPANAPADIAYDVPKAWQVQPNTNQMRKATIKIPKQAGDSEDAELSVTVAGGSKEANVARWCNQLGQVEPSKKEERVVNGLPITIVEVKGEYAGMGGPKKPGYMLLGALVPAAQQQYHFFKMTGPEKTVTAARKDFDAFVGSFRAK